MRASNAAVTATRLRSMRRIVPAMATLAGGMPLGSDKSPSNHFRLTTPAKKASSGMQVGWDAKTQRIVVTGSEPRLYLLSFDTQVGRVTIDEAFHDADGVPGFNLADREWLHGWKGSGLPHGVVASR